MTPEDFLSESAALRDSGLDFARVALSYAGIEPKVYTSGSDPKAAALVYDLADGTSFVIRGAKRNDYEVGRYFTDAPDGDNPTHREEHLNLGAIVRVLTFERPLPLYMDTYLPEVPTEYQPKLRRGSILRRLLGRS